jgi:hypothetical protein
VRAYLWLSSCLLCLRVLAACIAEGIEGLVTSSTGDAVNNQRNDSYYNQLRIIQIGVKGACHMFKRINTAIQNASNNTDFYNFVKLMKAIDPAKSLFVSFLLDHYEELPDVCNASLVDRESKEQFFKYYDEHYKEELYEPGTYTMANYLYRVSQKSTLHDMTTLFALISSSVSHVSIYKWFQTYIETCIFN